MRGGRIEEAFAYPYPIPGEGRPKYVTFSYSTNVCEEILVMFIKRGEGKAYYRHCHCS